MAVREYFWKHPFGVIKTNGFKLNLLQRNRLKKLMLMQEYMFLKIELQKY